MQIVLIEVAVLLLGVVGLVVLLRRVRADHDAAIVEHWARNGRDRRPPGWD